MYTRSRRIRYRSTLSQKRKGQHLLTLLAASVLVGMTGLFLFHTNKIATDSFSLRAMEYDRASLEQQISRLQVQIATARSLSNIEGAVAEKGMVAIQDPLFINKNGSVAVNFD